MAFEQRVFGRSQTLTRRVIIAAFIWGVVVLIGGGIALTAMYEVQTQRLLDDELGATLQTLNRAVAYNDEGEVLADIRSRPSDPDYDTPLSGKYWAILTFDGQGKLVRTNTSDSIWDADVPLPTKLKARAIADAGQPVFANATGPANEAIRVGAKVILVKGGAMRLILLTARDRTKWDEATNDFRNLALTAMLMLFGGVMCAMLFQIRLSLTPLGRMQKDLSDIREGKRARLDDDYPAELNAVTSELNLLIEHNREVVERARTHVGNLAHALKTPIAVLHNEAKGKSQLDKLVREQASIMEENVTSHLQRARAAASAKALGARTEIIPIINGLARTMEKIFTQRGISIGTQLASGLVFRGEKQDFEEALGNLMENACKWATKRVRVSAEIHGPNLVIHVDDDGPGLSPDQREKALQRGERLDEAAPGTGLGLSIVAELAELYNGKFLLNHSPLGGLRASLHLPRL